MLPRLLLWSGQKDYPVHHNTLHPRACCSASNGIRTTLCKKIGDTQWHCFTNQAFSFVTHNWASFLFCLSFQLILSAVLTRFPRISPQPRRPICSFSPCMCTYSQGKNWRETKRSIFPVEAKNISTNLFNIPLNSLNSLSFLCHIGGHKNTTAWVQKKYKSAEVAWMIHR